MSFLNNKKLNVLMVNHEFPPIGGGGGTTTRFLAKYLTKLGVNVSILTAKPNNKSYFEHPDRFKLFYIGPQKTKVETSHIPEMMWFILCTLFSTKKIIEKTTPDLTHCFFSIPAGCFGLYAKKKYNIPYITSALGADVPGFNIGDWRLDVYHAITNRLSRAIWDNSSFVVANSPTLKVLCEKFDKNKKIEMITNGVDTDIFYPAQKDLKNDPVKLLFVSRFSPQKGIESLIEACGILHKKGINNFSLTIVGDGHLKNKIFSMINKYQINEKINFLGWKKLEELPDIYRSSDVFVLPSVMEGMPSVVLQAIACGLPIVSTKVEGFQELVENGVNGFTVEYNDSERLAECIEELIKSKELRHRMPRNSIEKSKRFSWERIAEKYLELYERTVFGEKISKIEPQKQKCKEAMLS